MAQTKAKGAAGSKTCPICGNPTVDAYRPFCSRRCADVDLNRWLSGSYAIPVTDEDDEDGEGASRSTAAEGAPVSGQPRDPDL